MRNLDERYAVALSRWVLDGMDYLRRGYADGSTALVSSSVHTSNWTKIIDLPNDIGRLLGEPAWNFEYREGQWKQPAATFQQMEALAAARLVEIEQMAKERKADEALMVDAKKKIAELRDILVRERTAAGSQPLSATNELDHRADTNRELAQENARLRSLLDEKKADIATLARVNSCLRHNPLTIVQDNPKHVALIKELITGTEFLWQRLDSIRKEVELFVPAEEREKYRAAARKEWAERAGF